MNIVIFNVLMIGPYYASGVLDNPVSQIWTSFTFMELGIFLIAGRTI